VTGWEEGRAERILYKEARAVLWTRVGVGGSAIPESRDKENTTYIEVKKRKGARCSRDGTPKKQGLPNSKLGFCYRVPYLSNASHKQLGASLK